MSDAEVCIWTMWMWQMKEDGEEAAVIENISNFAAAAAGGSEGLQVFGMVESFAC